MHDIFGFMDNTRNMNFEAYHVMPYNPKMGLEGMKAFYNDVYGEEVPYYDVGISGVAEPLSVVGEVSKNLPAFEAGLKKGDQIIAIDNQPIKYWREIQQIVTNSKGKALVFDQWSVRAGLGEPRRCRPETPARASHKL